MRGKVKGRCMEEERQLPRWIVGYDIQVWADSYSGLIRFTFNHSSIKKAQSRGLKLNRLTPLRDSALLSPGV